MKPVEGIRFAQKYSPVPLTDWQLSILEGIFSNRFSIIILPSGFGKTLLASLNVAANLIGSSERIKSFGVAADIEQAGLLDQSLEGVFEHPQLRRLVDIKAWKISLKYAPKSTHETLPTHVPSVWGRTPSILTCDELSEATTQSEKNFFAMVSALRKQKNSKLVIITSPSLIDSTAHKILEAVRHDPKWFVIEYTHTDVEASWLDLESEDVYDVLLPREIREAKHKGIWTDLSGNVLAREKIESMMQFEGYPDHANGLRSGGVDLALTRDHCGLAVVEQVERIYYIQLLHAFIPPKQGKIDLIEIEEEVFALASKFNCSFQFDNYQAILMQQRLIQRGVRCVEFAFTMESRRRLFGRLLDLIEAGRIKSQPHPELRKQLLSLIAKKLPSGGWRIDHRAGAKDDLIVAVALALEGLPEYSDHHLPQAIGRRTAFLGAEQSAEELVGWQDKGTRGAPDRVRTKTAWDVW